ncbi:MAG: hypothetical protein ACK5HL_03920 [Bacilli bacterium]
MKKIFILVYLIICIPKLDACAAHDVFSQYLPNEEVVNEKYFIHKFKIYDYDYEDYIYIIQTNKYLYIDISGLVGLYNYPAKDIKNIVQNEENTQVIIVNFKDGTSVNINAELQYENKNNMFYATDYGVFIKDEYKDQFEDINALNADDVEKELTEEKTKPKKNYIIEIISLLIVGNLLVGGIIYELRNKKSKF